jgi:hypothetical protein
MSNMNAPLDEQVFIALQAYEELKQGAEIDALASDHLNKEECKLSFTDIVHCVRQPQALASARHLSIINTSIDYRRKYRFVLMQLASLQSPRQIAASSSEQAYQRVDENFTLSMKLVEQDRAEVSMTLRADFAESSAELLAEQAYLHSETEQEIGVVVLNTEPCERGRFSALINAKGTHFANLTNINSHLYVTF